MDLEKIYSFLQWPVILWIFVEVIVIISIAIILRNFKTSKVSILFDLFYEKIFLFFEDILWKWEKLWLKTYLVILFFIILLANLIGVMIEFIIPVFWINELGEFKLWHFISQATADLNFTVAIAVISILLLIFVQLYKLWLKIFLLEYFPIKWKGYLVIDKWRMNKYLYVFINIIAKTFDIVLSIFLSLLEILWLFAKVISLSLRLFWNMTSWTLLVTMIVVWLSVLTKELSSFIWWYSFPIIFPVFIYIQEILVALIQAIIFPMLVAIFIKTSISDKW